MPTDHKPLRLPAPAATSRWSNPLIPLESRAPGGRHSDMTKLAALAVYAETGNTAESGRVLGLPQATVHNWVTDGDSPALIDSLRSSIRYSYGWKLSHAVGAWLDDLETIRQHGEAHLLKNGQVKYLPPKAKDAAIIASILIDKWALVSGAIAQGSAITQQLDGIANELKGLGASLRGKDSGAGTPIGGGLGETSSGDENVHCSTTIDNKNKGLDFKDIGG